MNHARSVLSAALIVCLVLSAGGRVNGAGSTPPHLSFLPLVMREPLPSSFELIQQAQQTGVISADTALLYNVYAMIDGAKLPAAYQGDVDMRDHNPDALRDAARRYKTLPPELQAALAPYLIPPIYAGSWWDLKAHGAASRDASDVTPLSRCDRVLTEDWSAVVGVNVKVWHLADPYAGTAAQLVANEVDTVIWPKLTTLMGQTPLSDTGYLCNGGDGKLDIYIAPTSAFAGSGVLGITPADDCGLAPYIMIRANLPPDDFDTVTAHEFMHTLQFRFPGNICPSYSTDAEWWLMESTAKWAEPFVYPNHPSKEQNVLAWARIYLKRSAYGTLATNEKRGWYAGYLFPYYLTRRFDNPSLIRDIFDATRTHEPLEAVDSVIPGGFIARWPEFARYNLNKRDLNFYEQWDGLPASVLDSSKRLLFPAAEAALGPTRPHSGRECRRPLRG